MTSPAERPSRTSVATPRGRAIKRQVFDAFGLQIVYDKLDRRIEISATITEAIAGALENAEDLPEEVSRSRASRKGT